MAGTGKRQVGLVDLDAMRSLARECDFTLREFVDFYLDHATEEIALLGTAIEEGDMQTAARLAHGSAGSSATARISGLVPYWRRVEVAVREDRLEDAAAALAEACACFEDVRATLARVVAEDEGA
ncbi:MAG: Hpt domain-containing protein [Planctomycetota bacterium]|jgi:HPt (histidine-containing phosphotransfer) domain-containing protein